MWKGNPEVWDKEGRFVLVHFWSRVGLIGVYTPKSPQAQYGSFTSYRHRPKSTDHGWFQCNFEHRDGTKLEHLEDHKVLDHFNQIDVWRW